MAIPIRLPPCIEPLVRNAAIWRATSCRGLYGSAHIKKKKKNPSQRSWGKQLFQVFSQTWANYHSCSTFATSNFTSSANGNFSSVKRSLIIKCRLNKHVKEGSTVTLCLWDTAARQNTGLSAYEANLELKGECAWADYRLPQNDTT